MISYVNYQAVDYSVINSLYDADSCKLHCWNKNDKHWASDVFLDKDTEISKRPHGNRAGTVTVSCSDNQEAGIISQDDAVF